MKNLLSIKVADLVSSNYRTADLFHRYGIDFCCNGHKTLEEACRLKNLNADQITEEIVKLLEIKDDFSERVNNKTLSELVDYIIDKHHTYVKSNIHILSEYLEKIAHVHGDNHPELHEVLKLYKESAGNLTMHMQKEELILFPHIKKMEKSLTEGNKNLEIPFGTVSNPIQMMIYEHESEGTRFEQISQLTNHYTIPYDACNTYRVALKKLEEFEKDLHTHIHLENNILFPKTIELEKKLKN